MLPLTLETIKMVWWNVNLSSVAVKGGTPVDESLYAEVLEGIKLLFNQSNCKMVALCEVSSEDVVKLSENTEKHISFIDGVRPAGKTKFDTAIAYDNRYLSVSHTSDFASTSSGGTIKSGQHFELKHIHDDKVFNLVLCHWPSRRDGTGQARREKCAQKLATILQSDILLKGDLVVMGDFNDNPSDDSVFKSLQATRCHEMAIKYPQEWLYNPFWRGVISNTMYNHTVLKQKEFISGTHRYKSDDGAFWHTLDQMFFSGSLLSTSDWHLNENETKVLSLDYFTSLFKAKSSKIDHMPIICELVKNKEG